MAIYSRFDIKMTEEQPELTALVIDDDASIRMFIPPYLKMQGISTDVTKTTSEGLGLLKQKRYGLVLTDLNQDPTGVEVYREATSRGMETYIMTGGTTPELLDEAKTVAGDNLLEKPFGLSTLNNIIEQSRKKLDPQS